MGIQKFLAVAVLLLLARPVWTMELPQTFEELPEEAKSQFSDYAGRWSILRPQILHAWHQMQLQTAEERRAALQALSVWADAPPSIRKQLVINWKYLRELPPKEYLALLSSVVSTTRPGEVINYSRISRQDSLSNAPRSLLAPRPASCESCLPKLVWQ